MSKKPIVRPFTLAIGILLILLALFNFIEAVNSDKNFITSNLILIVAGIVLILFALAKSGKF